MNKEQVILNIKELQEKILEIDERLFDGDGQFSALDLDTQLMYLRRLYDSYLSLRPSAPSDGKRKGRNRKETALKEEEKPNEALEEVETSLPLMFMEEESGMKTETAATPADKKPANPKGKTAQPEEAPKAAPAEPAMAETPAGPVAKETVKEAETKTAGEKESKEPEAKTKKSPEKAAEAVAPDAQTAPAASAAEAAESPKGENAAVEAEVDLSVLEDIPENPDIDLDAIEFDEESDMDDTEEEAPRAKREEDTAYEPYYPGLNPKAMDGELEMSYPQYAGKSGQTLGEHFTSQYPSLNDQLSQKKGEDQSLGSRKQRNQITDLTKSIDLNLKFTFVRELFNGNAKLLAEELNNLNQCVRLETALSLFEEMKEKYRWKEDNEAFRQLYELILRKYAR